MTRYAWVLNLDAELELSRRGYTTPARLKEQLARHDDGARALLGAEDVIAEPGIDAAAFIGRAWCPTPRAIALLRRLGVTPEPHPTPEVLRRVNHRLFAHELGGGLAGQRYVRSRDELRSVIASGHWLLKRPLAFAGRGQLRVFGALDPRQDAWVDASLRYDGLIVEPLVTPTRELSQHGFLWPDGRFALGRPCIQVVSAKGAFRAMRTASAAETHPALAPRATFVARALAAAGYFGPFGIDAYFHERGFCELSEINARYTMGFSVGFSAR